MKKLFILFIFFIVIFETKAQNIRYVKPVSTGTGDGSSWANASHDLQAMMNSLKGIGGQVWVARGTYKPLHKVADTAIHKVHENNKIPTIDRHKSFVMVKDVEVYGGFRGEVTDTDVHHRFHESILSGNIGIEGDDLDNVFHVVISVGDVGTACLDGFTITGGNTNEDDFKKYYIPIDDYFIWPIMGAGIYIDNSSPLIKNIIIKNNSAIDDWRYIGSWRGTVGSGAIIHVMNMSEPKFVNLIMYNNQSAGYSPIHIEKSFLTITNALIYNNGQLGWTYEDTAFTSTAITNAHSSLIITNSTIANNSFYSSSDTLYKMIISIGDASTYIRNSIIWNEYGGTIGNNGYTHEILVNNIIGSNVGGVLQGVNPLFIRADLGDYHLRPSSPAINAGNNAFYHPDSLPNLSNITTDLEGNPRINCIVDIGCYEYQELSVLYPHATIKGDTAICYGDSVDIAFTLTGNSDWDIVYTANNGFSYDTVKDISVSPYILKASHIDTTVYKLVSISNDTCENVILSDSIIITVIPELLLTEEITSDTLCHGEQTQEIIFESNANCGWQFVSGDTTGIPLETQTGNFGTYIVENRTINPLTSNIKVFPFYSKDNIYCQGRDTNFSITVLPEPVLQTILVNDTLCDGEQTKAIDFTGTATSFVWEAIGNIESIPAGKQTGDFGNYTVENKTETNLQSLITVSPQYELGSIMCFGKTESFQILIPPQTKVQSLTANKILFCEGELLELEAEASGMDLSYQWYYNNNLLVGAVNDFYIISELSRENMGSYYVTVTGRCGTIKSSEINIETSSDKILVEKWDDVILVDNSSYMYYGYQWYRNNIPIHGAVNQFYQELGGLRGCYSVELTLANGQKERTCERCIDKTTKSFGIYPNPVRQGENIQIETRDEIISVQLYSMEGKLIQTGNTTKTLTTNKLQQGIYIITIQTKEKIIYNDKIVIVGYEL